MAKRRRNSLRAPEDPFGRWMRVDITDPRLSAVLDAKDMRPTAVWRNDLYQVLVFREYVNVDGFPCMHWLSIKRLDKRAIHDWRDLQRIKNELIGRSNEAMELYPAESRLVDTSNQFHLWVLAEPLRRFPLGFSQRAVCLPHDDGWGGSKQRPWPQGQEPKDAMTSAQFNALCDDAIGPGMQVGPTTLPAYLKRSTPCDVCGATMDPHLCGVGLVEGVRTRFPIYPGTGAVDGPAAVNEGDKG